LFPRYTKIIPFLKIKIVHIVRSNAGNERLTVLIQGLDHRQGQLMTTTGLIPTILAGMMKGIVGLVFIRAVFFHGTPLMDSQKAVIPAQAGIQTIRKQLIPPGAGPVSRE